MDQSKVNLRRSVDPKELMHSVDVTLGDCLEAAGCDVTMRPGERKVEI